MQSITISSGVVKGKTPQTFHDFLIEYEKALKDGWKLPEKVTVQNYPSFLNGFTVVMYKQDDLSEILKDASLTKDDLKSICEDNGLEFPEDIKTPAAIRKKLREQLSDKQD